MTRELKFRAWDKNSGNMYYHGDIVGFQQFPLTNGDIINLFEDYEIMQFVGLKDKKGNDIYEGDIIRYKNKEPMRIGEERKEEKMAVIYKDHGFWLKSEYTHEIYNVTHFGRSLLYTKCEFEIIGNIYQNPLLIPVNISDGNS